MKTSIFLLLLGLCTYGGEAVTHSLKYFYTASTQIPNFPEFVTVGMVDDQEIEHYDSITGRAQVKQDWLAKYIADSDPQYSEENTQIYMGSQPTYKANIEILKPRFNQTGGVHTFQFMYGCELDDETKELSGYFQFGYDGEDFLSLDLPTETWTAAKQQAVISKQKWDSTKANAKIFKNYLNTECPEWIKKYVNYGSSSLMRTERPSVSLLQKSSSSPVTCHATGFYPNKAEMVWKKDGMELHEGVNKGEVITNNDGTFQMSVDLDVSSVKPEDWDRYRCVFQLSGVNEDIVTRLDKSDIKTNEKSYLIMIIAIVAVVVVLAAVIGILLYKKKTSKCSQPPMKDPAVTAPLNPDPTA